MKGYHDIVGDGGSDVLVQVTAQRQAITTALRGVRHRVAVASGKGGVGKSTVTMVLAQGFLARGLSVAILDADLNGPCQAQMAGLERTPWLPGPAGLAVPRRGDGLGVVSFGSFLDHAEPAAFATVATGGDQVWRATRELATLGQLLAGVEWGTLDVLLVDLPPGAERSAQMAAFFGAETAFVLVTIPSDMARGVVARSLTALRQADAKVVGYIENMAGYHHRDTDAVLPLFPAAATTLDLPCLGRLPFDPTVAHWCDQGWPENARQHGAIPGAADLADHLLTALEAP